MNNKELSTQFFHLLSKCDIISGNFVFSKQSKEDWSNIVIENKQVENARFENISFMASGIQYSKLDHCIFNNCELELDFSNCDFKNMRIDSGEVE